MIKFIYKRLSYGFLVILGVAIVVFFIFHALPGDPVAMMAGQRTDVSTRDAITAELDSLDNNGVRLLTIGDIEGLPDNCRKSMENAIFKTKDNKGITLILALNYSARIEITKAFQSIITNNKDITSETITPALIAKHLYTKSIPDPELLIRTSGENRVSNFMLWQIAYTELHFSSIFWPEFRREHFITAIKDYQNRERRFGKTSEQIQ